MNILILGGTGTISHAVAESCTAAGFDVTVVTRGVSRHHPDPSGARVARGDIRHGEVVPWLLENERFDVAIDFLAFTPDHIAQDIDWFRKRVGQFVFISSASAYQTPPARLPVTESTPLRNPYWQYSRNKIACEDLLLREYRNSGFPATIVRPSHTYDQTTVPFDGGWTAIERMRQGKPMVVPGDGTSLWTLTHTSDFARAFVALLGRRDVAGEAFHITSDEALTWNEIFRTLAAAAGVTADLVPVPSETIARFDEDLGAALLGDKANSMVFDNTSIRRIARGWEAHVPFTQGAREIIAWHDADPARRAVDPHFDQLFDTLTTTTSHLTTTPEGPH